MRKPVGGVIVGLVAAAGAMVALAQSATAGNWPAVMVHPSIKPNKAGSRKHPQGVKLITRINLSVLGQASQPIVTKFLLLFPNGSLYNGGHVTSCSLASVKRGPQACPKASIMGAGSGTAYADTEIIHPKITVVNGGGRTVYFYTVLNNPALVQEPVIGHINRVGRHYAYSLSVSVPQKLQVVAGVPIELTSLSFDAGKGSWLATTGCSSGRWPFSITTSYLNPNSGATGSSTENSSTPCRK